MGSGWVNPGARADLNPDLHEGIQTYTRLTPDLHQTYIQTYTRLTPDLHTHTQTYIRLKKKIPDYILGFRV